ncbi:peptidase A1 family protein [Abortiporus biennis]
MLVLLISFLALLNSGAFGIQLRRVFPRAVAACPSSTSDCTLTSRQQLQSVENGVNMNITGSPVINSAIVPLTLSSDQRSYYTIIQSGHTSFRIGLDTASADLWLVSSSCTSGACSALPKYQLGYQSPTFVPVNSNSTAFNVSYADGTVANGFVAMETVQLSNLTVPNQAFGVVTDTNVTSSDQVSGILGLGFPRLSRVFNTVVNATPFFATMAQRGLLDYPLFGISLTRNSSGSLTFGAIDGSVVSNTSLIEWNEVVPFAPFAAESNTSSYLQWTIPMKNFFVNGTAAAVQPTFPNITAGSSLALFDVGASGIFGPWQDVERLFTSLGGRLVDASGQWAVPCDVSETIAFQFNQQQFVLQPTDYLIGPATGSPGLCLSWPRASPPSADGIDWQFGTPFLRTVYSVYSFGIDRKEPPMIGLYPLNAATAPVESPEQVEAFFSSASAAIATTLPNFPIATPTFTTPAYEFNVSVTASQGAIVTSGLATSTYSAVLATKHANVTAIQALTPSPTLVTFLITQDGQVRTSVSTVATPTVTLGAPPGWNAGTSLSVPMDIISMSSLLVVLFSFLSSTFL